MSYNISEIRKLGVALESMPPALRVLVYVTFLRRVAGSLHVPSRPCKVTNRGLLD